MRHVYHCKFLYHGEKMTESEEAIAWFESRMEYFAVKNPQEIAHIETIRKALRGVDELTRRVKKLTGCRDTTGREIEVGHVVHWSDGGDDLDLYQRIKTRWDRIAVVQKSPDIQFRVIDSPAEETKRRGNTFNFGNFIYQDTEKYLTIVAENETEYRKKFNNAGECMSFVINARANFNSDETGVGL